MSVIPPSERLAVRLTVNGRPVEHAVEARRSLADFLREDLALTGTHVGCEHGVCGACTVLVDGRSARSCLYFAAQLEGARVTTIEGLAQDGQLHPMQEAFRQHHGLQCGYCTPGMIMAAVALAQTKGGNLDEHTIREGLEGNLCRCTGYHNIVKAIAAGATMVRIGTAIFGARKPEKGTA